MAISVSGTTITFNDATTQTTAGLTGSSTQLCRAWVNFNGTNGTIRASFNMSSITRASAGVYTLNFTTAMSNADYAIAGFANFDESASPAGIFTAGNNYAPTTSSTSIRTANCTNGAASNSIYVCAVIFST
jgi:hypothetical protein